MSIVKAIILPLVLLGAALFAAPHLATLGPAQRQLIRYLPSALALVGMLLAMQFNRSRIFFALLTLALAYPAMVLWPQLAAQHHDVLIAACIAVVSLNLALLSVASERGIFSRWGLARFVIVGGETIGLGWLMRPSAEHARHLFVQPWAPLPLERLGGLPHTATVVFLFAGLVLGLRLIARPNLEAAAFTGAFAAFLGASLGTSPERAVALLSAATLVLTIAVVRASYTMAYIDELTGLPGRRALEEALKRLAGTYCIAMVDVDRFKRFNDRHGHAAGDEVLKMVAKQLRKVGAGGKAFRYGGEEFAILFTRTSADQAMLALEDVRMAVADHRFAIRGSDRPTDAEGAKKRQSKQPRGNKITISIGLAWRTDDLSDPWKVIEVADTQLYAAKNNGRNRIEIA